MKTIIQLIISLVLPLSPVVAVASSCPMLSDIKKDQHVHVVFKGTPKGHIKGKVLRSDGSNCILIISTRDEYRKYYIDVSCVAAIGTK